jgi:2-haloacid dehalogenase
MRSSLQLAVDELGVAAAAVCFQSSNVGDAAGVGCFGYQIVWINRFG